jgi:hypothetical protein
MNLYNRDDVDGLNDVLELAASEYYVIDIASFEELHYYFDGYAEVLDAVVNVCAADGTVRASYDAVITQSALSYYYNAE